jgi:hypothetical protein
MACQKSKQGAFQDINELGDEWGNAAYNAILIILEKPSGIDRRLQRPKLYSASLSVSVSVSLSLSSSSSVPDS